MKSRVKTIAGRYRKGARKEYAIMKDLRAQGWYCMRSSGSHGVIDIIAIHVPNKIIKVIQSKAYSTVKLDGELRVESVEIINMLKPFEGTYQVIAELL